MSEYQYYEFRAVDRPLGKEAMEELRRLSSRAEITPTQLAVTYNYGSFRGDPDRLVDQHFDAFVHVTNWGTRRLSFRVPRGCFDLDEGGAFGDGEFLSIRAGKDHVVVSFQSDCESEDWLQGETWMPALLPIRDELMQGDLRALALGWLSSLACRDADLEEAESPEGEARPVPHIPSGMRSLSAPQNSLAEFLGVDPHLIEAAAKWSVGEPPSQPSRASLARWVAKLSADEKGDYLLGFLADRNDAVLRAQLLTRYRKEAGTTGERHPRETEPRTVAQLFAARDALRKAKHGKEADERKRRLDDLARREEEAWSEVDDRIARRNAESYDLAVELLSDLGDLAARSNRTAEFPARIDELRRAHRGKSAFTARLDRKFGK